MAIGSAGLPGPSWSLWLRALLPLALWNALALSYIVALIQGPSTIPLEQKSRDHTGALTNKITLFLRAHACPLSDSILCLWCNFDHMLGIPCTYFG